MNIHKVWLDCDVGTDDAAAILCANKLEGMQIVGISAVAGNVELEKTYANTLRLNRLMGTDYPVYAGADKPLLRPAHTGYAYHGENGLGGIELPLPEPCPQPTVKAWDALYETAKCLDGELELVATGPLTNVATALAKYADLPKLLKRIVIMGGSATVGNRTPAAEYNIYADPEAAAAVFQAGIPLVMCGLDVTLKAYFTEDELLAVKACGNAAGALFHDCLQTAMAATKLTKVMLHDVVAVLYVTMPELFSGKEAGVYVETQSEITLGKTVTDLYSDKKFPEKNAFVVLDVNREDFVQTVSRLIRANP